MPFDKPRLFLGRAMLDRQRGNLRPPFGLSMSLDSQHALTGASDVQQCPLGVVGAVHAPRPGARHRAHEALTSSAALASASQRRTVSLLMMMSCSFRIR